MPPSISPPDNPRFTPHEPPAKGTLVEIVGRRAPSIDYTGSPRALRALALVSGENNYTWANSKESCVEDSSNDRFRL